jgi:hypothetical protein
MGISVVQKAGFGAGSGVSSQASGALPGNVASGNALIAFALTNKVTAQPSVSSVSNGHDTFTLAAHLAHTFTAVNFLDIFVYFVPFALGGYTSQVTFTFDAAVTAVDVGMLEIKSLGNTVVDQSNSNFGTTSTTPTTGAITTVNANELILALLNVNSTLAETFTEPGSYISQMQESSGTLLNADVATRIAAAILSGENPQWSLNNAPVDWLAGIVSFQAVAPPFQDVQEATRVPPALVIPY